MRPFRTFLCFVVCFISHTAIAQTLSIVSPDGETMTMFVEKNENGIEYSVDYNGETIVQTSKIQLKTITKKGEYQILGNSQTNWLSATENEYSGEIVSHLLEKSYQPDEYNSVLIHTLQDDNTFDIEIRVYNNGFAIRYIAESKEIIGMDADSTTINLSVCNLTYYTETGSESGYTKRTQAQKYSSWTPLFAQNENLAITINEACNEGIANKAKCFINNGIVSFTQTISATQTSFTTPWRYVVVGSTPLEMIENKYIIYSLNEENNDDTEWIRPGKVFRSLANGTNIFYTDTVKQAIDFAANHNFEYVLLDAGWYGLGYSNEKNAKSNPFVPVSTLNIEECIEHANEKNIGILLYVNKVAWDNYDNRKIIDTYATWGAKGIKLGYIDGTSQQWLKKLYEIVAHAYKHEMLVNVHDEFRPTGVERKWPNLLTAEGIRGNENTTNTSAHTTLLPFTRFMSGAADYTFCFPGYPLNPESKVAKMVQTKCHQAALSMIYSSPLQHLLWYGMSWQYAQIPEELNFFEELETTWDDYVLLGGEPEQHFGIARRKGDKWFVGAITNRTPRELTFNLDFLDSSLEYTARLFEDGEEERSIKETELNKISYSNSLSFSLKTNGGAVAIFYPNQTPTHILPLQDKTNIRIVQHNGIVEVVGSGMQNISIYSISGVLVAQHLIKPNTTQHSISNLRRGIYIFVIDTESGTESHKVFVNK